MKLKLLLVIFLVSEIGSAQVPDSAKTLTSDSAKTKVPTYVLVSIVKKPVKDSSWKIDYISSQNTNQLTHEILNHHPWFGFNSVPRVPVAPSIKKFQGKELLFYIILGLLILFAFLKRAFPKYFNDMFRLFFRTTLKQRQIREQLIQTPLPSLMLNVFFVITGGFYISFLLQHYQANPVGNFWLLVLYCSLGLSVAYFIKFVGLKVSGWLFNMEEAAGSYIFIIFIINKMLAIMLLPFLVMLAFSSGKVYQAGLTLSWCMIAGLLIYRFILTYSAVRNEVKVNPFHFFLYILAFEIAPLLLVYKGLLLFFSNSA